LTFLIIFIVLFVVFRFGLTPLLLRERQSFSANPDFRSVSLTDPGIPAAVVVFWREVGRSLKELGFTPVGYVVNSNLVPRTTTYPALFENHEARTTASAIVVSVDAPQAVSRQTYSVVFETHFADGTTVETNNAGTVLSTLEAPWIERWQFPCMADLALLFQVHEGATARRSATPKPLSIVANRVDLLRADFFKEIQARLESGTLYANERTSEFKYTVKGAYLSAWALLWPISAIRRQVVTQRARQLLRELGLSEDYAKVDYPRLIRQRQAEEPPAVAETPPGPLQFDKAEFTKSTNQGDGPRCTSCSRPIATSYYDIDGKMTCPDCHAAFARREAEGSRFRRTFRASLAGASAGVVGAGINFAVVAATGYFTGLVAILLGVLVGVGVRWGAERRGGWFYQLLAVGLAYLSIAASYSATVVVDVVRHPERYSPTTASAPGAAGVAGHPDAAATDDDSATEHEDAEADDDDSAIEDDEADTDAGLPGQSPAPSLGDVLVPLASLAMIFVALPVLVGVDSPIMLLISGFALWEAWKLNKASAPRMSGPYTVATAASPAPPGTPEDRPHG
jgi:hypothetical protein